jgi:hypothetical protein
MPKIPSQPLSRLVARARWLFCFELAVCFIWFLTAADDGIGAVPPGPQLSALSYTPAERLRGAHLAAGIYNDPRIRFWKQVEEFPKWGGNVFSINLSSAEDGVAILPGRPLTERLAKALESYTTVIDWALQHNIHIILRFSQRNTAGGGPLTWPDDGRSMWKDASAQDELVQAWADLAKRFKGRNGFIFNLVAEPHGETADEIAGNHALPKQVWNTLYPRLIDAIRAEDPERWIIVMPIWGNVDNLVALSVSAAPNLIYSFHFYEPHFFTHQGLQGEWPPAQSVVYPGLTRDGEFRPELFYDRSLLEQRLQLAVNFRNAYNVRVMCGEFGTQNNAPMDSRKRWVMDWVSLLETHGFDWLYFEYERLPTGPGAWTFQRTAYESVMTSKLNLNLEYNDFDAGGNLLLAGGVEKTGLSRGPAFQLFSPSGALQAARFAFNPDFRSELSFLLANFDADAADEVLVGGRETSGLARGPAYQVFDTDGTPKFTRFVLSPDFSYANFSALNVGSNGVLVCGQELDGLSRGPAYQAFDASGNLVHTQFALGPDFTLKGCVASNLDGLGGDEVIVWGRESVGLERGLAVEVFGPTGSLLFTRFVLDTQFAETGLTVVDAGGSKNIVIYGRRIAASNPAPGYQLIDLGGTLSATRFVLSPDFTAFQLFGANTTNSVSGQEIVTGGLETGGLARGPMYQVWNKNGNLLLSRFVLNPDFTEVTFSKIDINNDGLDEILVVGRETKGLARGPAFQLLDGGGNVLVGTQFVLNSDFTNLKVFTVDQNGDGDKEIGIGGIETAGLKRGSAYQVFESNGTLLQTQFVPSLPSQLAALRVTEFHPTASGFDIRFNKPIDRTVLNLYDTETHQFGSADLTLVGANSGPVTGSLYIDGTAQAITFVKTGRILTADAYTVTLRSTADAFKDADGQLLDGDTDGTPGGNYVAAFALDPATVPVISVSDFAVGPGQPVNVPFNRVGIPVSLSDGNNITGLDFTITYDPALLTLNRIEQGDSLPPDALLQEFDVSRSGAVRVSFSFPTPLPAGPVEVLRLGGSVPANAPYKALNLITFESATLNQTSSAVIDDALHIVAYIGDATGNGSYSSLDGQRVLRVVSGLDGGFAAYPLVDPVIVGDVTGNGSLSSLDATRILQKAAGLDRPEIPSIPSK